jgi:hypothetical protein
MRFKVFSGLRRPAIEPPRQQRGDERQDQQQSAGRFGPIQPADEQGIDEDDRRQPPCNSLVYEGDAFTGTACALEKIGHGDALAQRD